MTTPSEREALIAERKRFEHWYTTHAFDYARDPVGSRDCSLQWVAWQAALASAPAQAEPSELRDVLLRNGFVPCDIAACNCGSWHARFGLKERIDEIKDDLAEAGHPLCNENGNLVRNALKELIAERDALATQSPPPAAPAPQVLPDKRVIEVYRKYETERYSGFEAAFRELELDVRAALQGGAK